MFFIYQKTALKIVIYYQKPEHWWVCPTALHENLPASCWWFWVILQVGHGLPWLLVRIAAMLTQPGFSQGKIYRNLFHPQVFSSSKVFKAFPYLCTLHLSYCDVPETFPSGCCPSWHIQASPVNGGFPDQGTATYSLPWSCWRLAVSTNLVGQQGHGILKPARPSHTVWAYISCCHFLAGCPSTGSLQLFSLLTCKDGENSIPLTGLCKWNLCSSPVTYTNNLKECRCRLRCTETIKTDGDGDGDGGRNRDGTETGIVGRKIVEQRDVSWPLESHTYFLPANRTKILDLSEEFFTINDFSFSFLLILYYI